MDGRRKGDFCPLPTPVRAQNAITVDHLVKPKGGVEVSGCWGGGIWEDIPFLTPIEI